MYTVRRYIVKFIRFLQKISRLQLEHLFLFPVVFLWDELLLRLLTGMPLFSHLIYPIIFAISAGFICSAVTSLFQKRINRRISIILLFISAVFFTLECILKNTYQVYFDIFGIVNGTGNVVGHYGNDVRNAIIGGIGVIILFFLPLLLYLWRGKEQMPASRFNPLFVAAMVAFSFIIGGVGVLFAGNLSSTKDMYKGHFNYDTATQAFGLITSTRLDLSYGLFGNPASEALVTEENEDNETQTETTDVAAEQIDYGYNEMDIDFDELMTTTSNQSLKKLDEYVASLQPSNKNQYTGLFAGKNLITIVAEAFSAQVINEELTPTLYRMANKGIHFTDFYQPAWGGSTTTGEYSVLLGLVPLNGETSMMDTIDKNMYFTTGNQFQRMGDLSLAFHNGDYDYYNRDQTHLNLGFDDFLAWGNGLEKLLPEWSDDPETFEATLPLYENDTPFNAYYMTYSGHCTYDESSPLTKKNLAKVQEVYGDTYQDTTMYYFCYQLELEYAMEYLVGALEEKGLADDTVIVICSDHYPYGLAQSSTFGNSEDYLLDLYQTNSYDSFTQDRNACIIWSGCIEDMGLEVDTPTMSLDILPTLSNLFGFEYDSRLLPGRDVFSDAMPLALWGNGSFVTEEGRYDVNTNKFYPNDGVEVDNTYVDKVKNLVKNKISFSKQVVKYNYYQYLFGDDDFTGSENGSNIDNVVNNTTSNAYDSDTGSTYGSDTDSTAGNAYGNDTNSTAGNAYGNNTDSTAGNAYGNDTDKTTDNQYDNDTDSTAGNQYGNGTDNTAGNQYDSDSG